MERAALSLRDCSGDVLRLVCLSLPTVRDALALRSVCKVLQLAISPELILVSHCQEFFGRAIWWMPFLQSRGEAFVWQLARRWYNLWKKTGLTVDILFREIGPKTLVQAEALEQLLTDNTFLLHSVADYGWSPLHNQDLLLYDLEEYCISLARIRTLNVNKLFIFSGGRFPRVKTSGTDSGITKKDLFLLGDRTGVTYRKRYTLPELEQTFGIRLPEHQLCYWLTRSCGNNDRSLLPNNTRYETSVDPEDWFTATEQEQGDAPCSAENGPDLAEPRSDKIKLRLWDVPLTHRQYLLTLETRQTLSSIATAFYDDCVV